MCTTVRYAGLSPIVRVFYFFIPINNFQFYSTFYRIFKSKPHEIMPNTFQVPLENTLICRFNLFFPNDYYRRPFILYNYFRIDHNDKISIYDLIR